MFRLSQSFLVYALYECIFIDIYIYSDSVLLTSNLLSLLFMVIYIYISYCLHKTLSKCGYSFIAIIFLTTGALYLSFNISSIILLASVSVWRVKSVIDFIQ